jgi:cell division protein ZapA (FtsZ GTPase activity inhibitor)
VKTTTININISGRDYPVNVTPDSEAGMKKAAALINEHVKTYSASYAIKDPRDLLAMCALQLAFQQIEKGNAEQEKDNIENKVKAIESVLHLVR